MAWSAIPPPSWSDLLSRSDGKLWLHRLLSIKGREERVNRDGSDVIICVFTPSNILKRASLLPRGSPTSNDLNDAIVMKKVLPIVIRCKCSTLSIAYSRHSIYYWSNILNFSPTLQISLCNRLIGLIVFKSRSLRWTNYNSLHDRILYTSFSHTTLHIRILHLAATTMLLIWILITPKSVKYIWNFQ